MATTGTHQPRVLRLRAPALTIALCLSAGIAFAAHVHPPPLLCVVPALLLLITASIPEPRFPARLHGPIGCGLALLCGVLRLALAPEPPAPGACPGVEAVAWGTVVERDAHGRGCVLELDSGRTAGGALPPGERIFLTGAGAGRGRPAPDVAPGERLRAQGLIASAAGEGNPGELSPAAYWRSRGVRMRLAARALAFGGDPGGFRPGAWIARAREAVAREARLAVPGAEGELLNAMLTGERAGIPRATRDAMIDAGVAHVLAVSGYRVYVLHSLIAFLLSVARIDRRRRPFVAAPLLLFYMAFTGSRAPVVRATVTALVFQAGTAFSRRASARNALGVAGAAILIADPRQLFDEGFQLSFAAVFTVQEYGGVMARCVALARGSGVARALLRAALRGALLSVAATLGTLPLSASAFGRVSLIGVIANIVVVPATGLGMILGIAALASGGAHTAAGAAYAAADRALLGGTLRCAHVAASIPLASVETPGFGAAWTVAWYALLAIVPMRRRRRGAALCAAVILGALNVCVWRHPEALAGRTPGALRVTMIDVGQGDAILAEFPGGKTLLIDAGGRSPAFDAGKERVLPFLKRRNIRALDALLITHPDIDHAGGAPAVLRGLRVRELLCAAGEGARDYVAAAERAGTPVTPVRDGMRPGADFPGRLYLIAPRPGGSRGTTNDRSIVLRIVYGRVALLFTGDAGAGAERTMIARYGPFLSSQVLKVAHHGSAGATSDEFLSRVRPGVALVSVGRGNRYGHPSPGVIARLIAAGARVLRTDCGGAGIVETDGSDVRVRDWRAETP